MICRRYWPMEGVENFRDLGGFSSNEGVTKWNVLYRSTSLHKATEKDISLLEKLEIGTVIDLRYVDEAQRQPDKLPSKVKLINIPIMGTMPVTGLNVNSEVENTKTLIRMYKKMMLHGQPQIALAIRTILDTDKPIVFHCAAGKDRTGVLAMLILGALGVSKKEILADYEVSRGYINSYTSDISGSHWTNMERLMEWIDSKWGGVRGFLKVCGIEENEIIKLGEKMIIT